MTTELVESTASPSTDDQIAELRAFLDGYARLFVLTGAGCSTGSGIPDYRDQQGAWKRTPPITLQLFLANPLQRARYWARSIIGWRRFGTSSPNHTHHALAALERSGRVEGVLTQNVDGLHQAAGSDRVIDLHGRLDTIRCLRCEARS
ncbi:MAG: Sir2 family NAD-dependent protein deacetylase, partial [Dokdonella sp.]